MSDNQILNAILDKDASDANIKEGLKRREFTKDELRDALLARKGNETMDRLRTRMFPEALNDNELIDYIVRNMPSYDETSAEHKDIRKPNAETRKLIDLLRKREFGFSVLMKKFFDYIEPPEPHTQDPGWNSGSDYHDPFEHMNAEKDGKYAMQAVNRQKIASIMALIDADTTVAFFHKLLTDPNAVFASIKGTKTMDEFKRMIITSAHREGFDDERKDDEVISDYEKAKIIEIYIAGLECLAKISGKAMILHADAIFASMFHEKEGSFKAPSIGDKTLEAMGRILAWDSADGTLTLDDIQRFIDRVVETATDFHERKKTLNRAKNEWSMHTDYSFYAIASLGPLAIKPLAALLRPYIENGCKDRFDENTVESLAKALQASMLHWKHKKLWAHVDWASAIEALLSTAIPALEIKLEGEHKMGTRTNRVYDALTRAISDAKEYFQKETRAVSKRNPDIGFALEALRMQKLGLEVDLEGFKATVRRIGAGLLKNASVQGPIAKPQKT